MLPRLVTAFGETKNMQQWIADPRCTVSINILRRRLNDGWDPETALDTPVKPGIAPAPPLAPELAERLAVLAARVADGPRVHRHTPPAAPEAVALQERNDLIRKALAGGHTITALAAATGLSDEQISRVRHRRR